MYSQSLSVEMVNVDEATALTGNIPIVIITAISAQRNFLVNSFIFLQPPYKQYEIQHKNHSMCFYFEVYISLFVLSIKSQLQYCIKLKT